MTMTTPEALARMLRDYRDSPRRVDEIAKAHGVSERTLHREARRAGIKRNHWITEKDAARVVRLYADGKGLTMAAIQEATGYGRAAIKKALRDAGVRIRRGRRYDG